MAMKQLEDRIDEICQYIIEGKTFTVIAAMVGTSRGLVFSFLNLPVNSARAQEACLLSAHSFTDMAREVLENARGSSSTDMMIARELSQHYMKMASFRNRSIYSEEKALPAPVQDVLPKETLLLLAEKINGNAASC